MINARNESRYFNFHSFSSQGRPVLSFRDPQGWKKYAQSLRKKTETSSSALHKVGEDKPQQPSPKQAEIKKIDIFLIRGTPSSRLQGDACKKVFPRRLRNIHHVAGPPEPAFS